MYYGEHERYRIIKDIKEIKFLFLLSDAAYLSCKNIPDNDFTKNLKHYFKINKFILDTLARRGASNVRLLSESIKQSMIDKYPRSSFEYYLHEEFVSCPSNGTIYFDNDGSNPTIILPIYFVNDRIIFHEINHVLTTPKKQENLFPFEEVDELLNDLISQDILKILKSLGGKILPYKLEMENVYDDNLFLMAEFYDKFKDLIKICVRNADLKYLEESLGEYNLYLYFALVKRLYHKKYITDIDLEKIKFLVNQMEQYYKTKKVCYNIVRLRKVG